MVTDQKPTSETQTEEDAQPPAEDVKPDVTAEQAETPPPAEQEKDALAELTDDQLQEHPRLKELIEKQEKTRAKESKEKLDKAIGKEKRRIASEERDRANQAVAQQRANMREQVLAEIASEDDPDRRQNLRAQLGMQEAIDNARRDGTSGALGQWHAEGRLFLEENELLPSDPREKAELQIRVQEKYGSNANFFQQTAALMDYWRENYVPKSEVDRLAQEKATAMRESELAEASRNEQTPVELPPTGGTVADYLTACDLFNKGEITATRFKELKRQFGVD